MTKYKVWFRTILVSPISYLVLITLVSALSRFIRNGIVYGLDFHIFQPDGSLYMSQTLHYLGHSWTSSESQTNDFYNSSSFASPSNVVLPTGIGSLLATRPLYAIFSMPFVYYFGPVGMIVVPILSLLITGLAILKFQNGKSTQWVAVGLFAWINLSPTVTRWVISNLTDSLLFMMVGLICLILERRYSKYLLLLTVAAALLIRPSGPIIFALLFPFLFTQCWRSIVRLLLPGIILVTLAMSIAVPESAGTQTSGAYTLKDRIFDLPEHTVSVFVVEVGQLFVLDKILFIFLLISLGLSLRHRQEIWSRVNVSVFIACFFMGAWNGALGVNFRYQLPCLIPAVLVILKSITSVRYKDSSLNILFKK